MWLELQVTSDPGAVCGSGRSDVTMLWCCLSSGCVGSTISTDLLNMGKGAGHGASSQAAIKGTAVYSYIMCLSANVLIGLNSDTATCVSASEKLLMMDGFHGNGSEPEHGDN